MIHKSAIGLLLSLSILFLQACSSTELVQGLTNPNKDSEEESSDEEGDQLGTSAEGESEELASIPQEVSGSFLCLYAAESEVDSEEIVNGKVLGCGVGVLTKDGFQETDPDAEISDVEVTYDDGRSEKPRALVAQSSSRWHSYYEVQDDSISNVSATVTTVGKTTTAETSPKGMETIANTADHLVYLTASAYSIREIGGFDEANRICELENPIKTQRAAAFLYQSTSNGAMLSPTIASESSRQYRSMRGNLIANNMKQLTTGVWSNAGDLSGTKRFWVGANTSGSWVATCNNWTDPEDSGDAVTGKINNAMADYVLSSCEESAYLLCITNEIGADIVDPIK